MYVREKLYHSDTEHSYSKIVDLPVNLFTVEHTSLLGERVNYVSKKVLCHRFLEKFESKTCVKLFFSLSFETFPMISASFNRVFYSCKLLAKSNIYGKGRGLNECSHLQLCLESPARIGPTKTH